MSTERLDEIRARLAAATPGPWTTDVRYGEVVSPDKEVVARAYAWTEAGAQRQAQREANTLLVAHAPADLAFLLAEVERLADVVTLAHEEIVRMRAELEARDALTVLTPDVVAAVVAVLRRESGKARDLAAVCVTEGSFTQGLRQDAENLEAGLAALARLSGGTEVG